MSEVCGHQSCVDGSVPSPIPLHWLCRAAPRSRGAHTDCAVPGAGQHVCEVLFHGSGKNADVAISVRVCAYVCYKRVCVCQKVGEIGQTQCEFFVLVCNFS